MKNKNKENQYIGEVSIIIVVILAVVGLYYLYSHRALTGTSGADVSNVPIEAPAPVSNNTEKNQ